MSVPSRVRTQCLGKHYVIVLFFRIVVIEHEDDPYPPTTKSAPPEQNHEENLYELIPDCVQAQNGGLPPIVPSIPFLGSASPGGNLKDIDKRALPIVGPKGAMVASNQVIV